MLGCRAELRIPITQSICDQAIMNWVTRKHTEQWRGVGTRNWSFMNHVKNGHCVLKEHLTRIGKKQDPICEHNVPMPDVPGTLRISPKIKCKLNSRLLLGAGKFGWGEVQRIKSTMFLGRSKDLTHPSDPNLLNGITVLMIMSSTHSYLPTLR